MTVRTAVAGCLLLLLAPARAAVGDGVIRAPAGTSEVVITTSARFAGAIESLRWGGMEYVDAADHGRQIQSAASFDLGLCKPFWAECFNPTEAGSRRDGSGPTSTSVLMGFAAEAHVLRTVNRMAFWLAPGERSEGRLALNTNALSAHVLRKRVAIGVTNLPQVLDYAVEFVVPITEYHRMGQFEALTGYMPPAFSQFHTFDPATGQLAPLTDGPGEQALPVILSTEDGAHAMGIVARPAAGCDGPRYGRWRFRDAAVNKWNCVYRVRDANRIRPGSYRFQVYVPFGTREDVRQALVLLTDRGPLETSPR